MSAVAQARPRPERSPRRIASRHGWTLGVIALFVVLLIVEANSAPAFSSFDFQSLVIAALPLAFTGAGAYSVDARLGFDALRGPTVAWIALAAAIVVALINVALRRPSAPARIAA